jgi:serine/threonine protein kinase
MADRGEVEPQDAGPAGGVARGIVDPLLLRAQARVGTTLCAEWRLDALISIGGVASVYAATRGNGGRVEVKVLHPELSTNAVVRERFLWEGYVANAVDHDGVVMVIDDEAEDGSLFVVTELLEGETLEERRLRLGGRLPEEEVLLATDQLLSVLVAAHANGIVHQDLKPANVFLTRAGQVKVLGFGVARLRELSALSILTQGGVTAGTPAYMPPEQARGLSGEVDERSDLWSCGAMMFCLLAGREVHEGCSADEQLANAMTLGAPPLASVAPHVAASVSRLVDRALEFSKEMRWPSADRMQGALRLAYQGLNGRPITTAPRLTFGVNVPRPTPRPAPEVGLLPDQAAPTTLQPVAAPSEPPAEASAGPPAEQSPTEPSAEPPSEPAPASESDWQAVRPWRAWRIARAAGGAVAFGVAVISVTWLVSGAHPSAQAHAASIVAQPTACLPSTPAVAVSTARSPEVSVIAPAASIEEKPARQPGHTTRKPAASAPASPSTRSDCRPPYVVDADTGKKHWKLDCL